MLLKEVNKCAILLKFIIINDIITECKRGDVNGIYKRNYKE